MGILITARPKYGLSGKMSQGIGILNLECNTIKELSAGESEPPVNRGFCNNPKCVKDAEYIGGYRSFNNSLFRVRGLAGKAVTFRNNHVMTNCPKCGCALFFSDMYQEEFVSDEMMDEHDKACRKRLDEFRAKDCEQKADE